MPPRKQPWFRFYTEAVSDRKLRRLSIGHRWLWVVVLAAAKQSEVEGMLMLTEREAMTVADLADLAGMKEREVTAGMEAMVRLGLLEVDRTLGCWVVVAWHKRQYASDDTTSRTRKHRSRNGPEPPPGNDDGTAMERSNNGDGTDQIQRLSLIHI